MIFGETYDVLMKPDEMAYVIEIFGEINTIKHDGENVIINEMYKVPNETLTLAIISKLPLDKDEFLIKKINNNKSMKKLMKKCRADVDLLFTLYDCKFISKEKMIDEFITIVDKLELDKVGKTLSKIVKHISTEEWNKLYKSLSVIQKLMLLKQNPKKFQGEFSIDECAKYHISTYDGNVRGKLNQFIVNHQGEVSDETLFRSFRQFDHNTCEQTVNEMMKRKLYPKDEKIYNIIIRKSITKEYLDAYNAVMKGI